MPKPNSIIGQLAGVHRIRELVVGDGKQPRLVVSNTTLSGEGLVPPSYCPVEGEVWIPLTLQAGVRVLVAAEQRRAFQWPSGLL